MTHICLLLAALTVLAYSIVPLLVLVVVALYLNKTPFNAEAEILVQQYRRRAAMEPTADFDGGEDECKTTNCQAAAVAHARAKIGVVADNAANRMVVSRVIRDYMSGRAMRPSHVAFYAPVAIELYFIPTSQDVLAMGIKRSQAKAKAEALLARGCEDDC